MHPESKIESHTSKTDRRENTINPPNFGIFKSNEVYDSNTKTRKRGRTNSTSESENKKDKFCKYICQRRYGELEGLLLFQGCIISLVFAVQDNLLYHKMCLEEFPTKPEWCYQNRSYNLSDKLIRVRDVVIASSSHNTYVLLTKSVTEFISSTFLCSWSDFHGRKFPFLISIVGGNFDLIVHFFKGFKITGFLYAFYGTAIISSSFGGYICILAMAYSYGTDNSSIEYRTFRFTMMDIAFRTGIIIGVIIFQYIDSQAVLISLIMILTLRLASVIVICFLFVDTNFKGEEENLLMQLKGFLSILNMESSFTILMKWRENCGSDQLRLAIFSALPVFIVYGLIEGVVIYVPRHSALFENFESYKEILRYSTVYNTLCEFLTITFVQFFASVKDSTLGLMGFFSLYLFSFVTAFADDSITFIVALSVAPFKGFASIALRSSVSKIVNESERGKAFLFLVASESFAISIGYVLHIKTRFVLGGQYPEISQLCKCTLLIIPFCAFTFQALSIHTEHLFSRCYRTFHIPDSIDSNLFREEESFEERSLTTTRTISI